MCIRDRYTANPLPIEGETPEDTEIRQEGIGKAINKDQPPVKVKDAVLEVDPNDFYESKIVIGGADDLEWTQDLPESVTTIRFPKGGVDHTSKDRKLYLKEVKKLIDEGRDPEEAKQMALALYPPTREGWKEMGEPASPGSKFTKGQARNLTPRTGFRTGAFVSQYARTRAIAESVSADGNVTALEKEIAVYEKLAEHLEAKKSRTPDEEKRLQTFKKAAFDNRNWRDNRVTALTNDRYIELGPIIGSTLDASYETQIKAIDALTEDDLPGIITTARRFGIGPKEGKGYLRGTGKTPAWTSQATTLRQVKKWLKAQAKDMDMSRIVRKNYANIVGDNDEKERKFGLLASLATLTQDSAQGFGDNLPLWQKRVKRAINNFNNALDQDQDFSSYQWTNKLGSLDEADMEILGQLFAHVGLPGFEDAGIQS